MILDAFRSVSLLNLYDVSNFFNCYLSAYNFVNTSIDVNPVYITTTGVVSTNISTFYTINYANTGSLIVYINALTAAPLPTPTPSITPTTTPTPTVTPTITLGITATPTPTVTPSSTNPITNQIIVSNAGFVGIRGIYTFTQIRDNRPEYVKDNYYKIRYWEIFPAGVIVPGTGGWLISNTDDDIFYYYATDDSNYPWQVEIFDEWEIIDQGELPPPNIVQDFQITPTPTPTPTPSVTPTITVTPTSTSSVATTPTPTVTPTVTTTTFILSGYDISSNY